MACHICMRKPVIIFIIILLFTSTARANLNNKILMAVRTGNKKRVEYLIKKGAKIDARYTSKNFINWTLLHFASEKGNLKVVKLLLEKGADINAQEKGGYSPLYLAVMKGQTKIVKILLEKCAKIFVKNIYNLSPLHLAAKMGNNETIK